MFSLFNDSQRPLLMGTIKAVAAIAFLSVLATKYLADGTLDQKALSRLAAEAAKGTPGEPSMTGSIGRSASAARIDPCTGAHKP